MRLPATIRVGSIALALFVVLNTATADDSAGPPSEIAVKTAANGPVELPPASEPEKKPAIPAPPAETEQRGLGKPVNMFTLPDSTSADKVEEDAGLLKAIDPRTSGISRIVVSLAVVVGLILILAKLARRMNGGLGTAGQPSGVLDVLARYPVARGQQLMLIKLDRRILLVHRGGVGMSTLAEVRETEDVASLLARIEAGKRESLGEKFQSLLERFNSEHDGMRSTLARDLNNGTDSVETIDLTRPRNPRGKSRR